MDALVGTPVLVLGGSGYLGRHICSAFTAAGARVVRVSRGGLNGDGTDGDGTDGDGCRSLRLDLTAAGPAELARLCADTGARVLVNAAGAVWGGGERQMAEANSGFVSRLTTAVAHLPDRPRLIHLGSAYEYGPAAPGTSIGEDWPTDPATVYGRTKLRGSQAVLRAAAEGSVAGTVLRVSVACGPGAPGNSLAGVVAAHLTAGHGELRLAPLRDHRDLVDVRDVADAVIAAAVAPVGAVTGAVVNIGSGRAVHVRRLVDLMIVLSGLPVRVVEDPALHRTRSDAAWQRLDIARARRLLGWAPRRTLQESLRDLLAAAGSPPAAVRTATAGGPGNSHGKDSR
ncbi:NAD(P)-dependent oxidoreductase [Streptomyces sp. NBS 14/10]|uniref:NAD-dependent epimerase/dehydratase family protein n=1 Tax=Streptomyces sp. NBS 14/10 TaxID=1945643 RepID=UPI000B7D8FE2|nr:NAD(P)-dependent oxidoreductase [Streptomyces sp. NBS 14/10]KAK1178074.1 NAD(P)-dependent oxidoreductase [Streptomyces sp. NBS 14/10]NUS86458.1 NAD(P)-dependent oxidoreductase [Streptomyces sp.]